MSRSQSDNRRHSSHQQPPSFTTHAALSKAVVHQPARRSVESGQALQMVGKRANKQASTTLTSRDPGVPKCRSRVRGARNATFACAPFRAN